MLCSPRASPSWVPERPSDQILVCVCQGCAPSLWHVNLGCLAACRVSLPSPASPLGLFGWHQAWVPLHSSCTSLAPAPDPHPVHRASPGCMAGSFLSPGEKSAPHKRPFFTGEGSAFVTEQPGFQREISVSAGLNGSTARGTALPPTRSQPGLQPFWGGAATREALQGLCHAHHKS